MGELLAYCVRCKEKKPMKNQVPTITKNKKHAVKGNCAVCDTKTMAFVKAPMPTESE